MLSSLRNLDGLRRTLDGVARLVELTKALPKRGKIHDTMKAEIEENVIATAH